MKSSDSAISGLKFCNRVRITIAAKGKLNVMWAMMMLVRFSGHVLGGVTPHFANYEKKTARLTPMQISGITIGRATVPS